MAWNGSQGSQNVGKKPVKRAGGGASLRGILAGVIVVVIGGLAAWFFMGKSAPAPKVVKTEKPKAIKEVRPATLPKKKPEVAQPKKLSREEMLFNKTNGYAKAAGKMLTDDGRVLTFPPPKDGEFRIVHSHGKMYKCDSKGNFEDITPKPVFDNAFENNLLGMAIEGGFFMPGMLTGHDANEITSMLIRKVEIKPDDPPDVVEKKEAVAALKQDIIDYIKEGGTFDDYVKGMRDQSIRDRSMKQQGLREIMMMVKKGDIEGAAMFRDKFNETVAKQGMTPIKLPKHIDEKLGGVKEESQEGNE